MTIQEAIQTAIDSLDGVRLPVRDADNANRIRTALTVLDALKEFAEKKQPETETTQHDTEKGADAE